MSDFEIARLGMDAEEVAAAGDSTAAHAAAPDAEPDAAPPLMVALYIHVPFCLSKCAYCDFESAVSDSRWHAPFVDAVLFAATHWESYDLLSDVPTLYVGGGTPTVLGDELVRLVEGLRDIVALRPDAEITVETNPDTTDPALIAALIGAGVNRFSLGVQSLDDAVLATLGRKHSAATAMRAAGVLARSGQPFSADLICGVAGQSESSWRDTVAGAVATGVGHLSVYPLSIEDGTPLAAAIEAGTMTDPDPDVAASMMSLAEELLLEAGIERYEVANYARPGQESRHNSSYWTGGAYLGLGPSAASMLPSAAFAVVADAEGWPAIDPSAARTRFSATCATAEFIRRPLAAPAEVEHLTAEEVAREDVMLGMRLSRGVLAEQVVAAGLADVLAGLEADGLVECGAGAGLECGAAADDAAAGAAADATAADAGATAARWRVTPRGWLLGNQVFGRIWQGSE